VTSSKSRQTNEDHEMRQLDGLERASSVSRKPVPAVAGTNTTNASLGIRRFIQGQQQQQDGSGYAHDDAITEEARDGDVRSVSSAEIAEKETSFPVPAAYMPAPASANSNSRNDDSATAFGQQFPPRQAVSRPSTAPANVVRRELNFLRPSSSGAGGPGSQQRAIPPSQRQRRNRTAVAANPHDEGSLLARLQSDGWHTRQIQSLERSPAGTALLGVDF